MLDCILLRVGHSLKSSQNDGGCSEIIPGLPVRLQHHLVDGVLLQDRGEASAGGDDGKATGVAAAIARPRRPACVQGGKVDGGWR